MSVPALFPSMKRALFLVLAVLLTSATAIPADPAPTSSAAGQFSGTEPEIISLRGKNVWVRVPEGFDRVTLQVISLRRGRGRKPDDANDWKTVGTKYPQRAAGVVQFRLGRLTAKRHLRVFGNKNDSIPSSFFTGITTFAADPAQSAALLQSPPGSWAECGESSDPPRRAFR